MEMAAILVMWPGQFEHFLSPLTLEATYEICLQLAYSVSQKMRTFFENAITPLSMEETFPNFLWL